MVHPLIKGHVFLLLCTSGDFVWVSDIVALVLLGAGCVCVTVSIPKLVLDGTSSAGSSLIPLGLSFKIRQADQRAQCAAGCPPARA